MNSERSLLDSETLETLKRYQRVRSLTEDLCVPLEIEDFSIQAMPDVSPPKWHLAHTTWFFERFFLSRFNPRYRLYHARYNMLFNSYYNAAGERLPRAHRGFLSRPTVADILDYRSYVNEHVARYIAQEEGRLSPEAEMIFETGLQHEQQHQELLLMDVKYNFFMNPLLPAYAAPLDLPETVLPGPADWIEFSGSLTTQGHDGRGFSFDNEKPRHSRYIAPFLLASRAVTNGEYLNFMRDGGYSRPDFWLSDGWDAVRREGWTAPLYWLPDENPVKVFTLAGLRTLDLSEPVCHLSFYEADAYARWAGARLPSESEWEAAAGGSYAGSFLEERRFHPKPYRPAETEKYPLRMMGDVWEWTQSPYMPYPGFKPLAGALGEYNGKFMCNQMVLRGGSCITPAAHVRTTYRNFFYPHQRWPFTGFRLARDIH